MWEKSSVIGVADYVIKLSCWLITFLLKKRSIVQLLNREERLNSSEDAWDRAGQQKWFRDAWVKRFFASHESRVRSSNMNRRERMVDKAGRKRGGRAGYKIFPGSASASLFRLDATASTAGLKNSNHGYQTAHVSGNFRSST
ncbi:hypothetical protein WN51_13763 [Melipona quadrifasciata]|uniref:Uncharacterized protein n=1 Tax=Melipona quadrifasciata TaxID=166423 RepID=A0A0M8ZYH4_9HYME|nr:hypothetical protein WN51_13763 [Melipona quadrifasciata]